MKVNNYNGYEKFLNQRQNLKKCLNKNYLKYNYIIMMQN